MNYHLLGLKLIPVVSKFFFRLAVHILSDMRLLECDHFITKET